MSVIHAPREHEVEWRHWALLAGVLAVLVTLFLKLWYLQVVRSDELAAKAESYRMVSVSKLAPRGLVFDRNRKLLAGVEPRIILTAVPARVNGEPWVLEKVAAMLGVPVEGLRAKVEEALWRPFLPAPLYIGVPIDVATRIAESGDHLPGIGVETLPLRNVSDPVTYSHVIGYVWTPSGEDVERLESQGLGAAEYVGKTGIERIYERELMGKAGFERLEVDAHRRPLRVAGRDAPAPGSKLVLGIDDGLQALAARLLEGKRGAAVALDPSTGEVLCLFSSPPYDSSLFAGGISKADWSRLQSDPNVPLMNRAIAARYAPGSTFKIVTTLAAYRQGVFSESRTTFCPGFFKLGNQQYRCLGKHGAVSFRTAISKSCNTYFCDLAHRAGYEAMIQAALDLGLGQPTGIDLPGESRGLVPTRDWLQGFDPPRPWYPGNTVLLGIGQGEIAATPVQMATLLSLVANRGTSYRPHVVKAVEASTGDRKLLAIEPEVYRRVEVDDRLWDALIGGLNEVLVSGTASYAGRIEGLNWAGKTGSAEHRRNELTHSWFVGFAPVDSPRIAIAVVVEAAGHGSEVAAPIARQLVSRYLGFDKKPALDDANSPATSNASPASASSPNSR